MRVLAELLEHAQASGLPVVAWQVASAGAGLVAQCFGRGAAQCRADFDAWCAALSATRWQERTTGSTTHLHAVADHYDGLVTVTMAADLLDVDDDPDHTGQVSDGPVPGWPSGRSGGEGDAVA